MSQKIAQFRASLGVAKIDREAGIIRDAKIIQAGPARGHGMTIDAKTLAEVKSCAERFGSQGFPIKFNPGTLDHGQGGYLARALNTRVEGDAVFADLHLLKNYEHRDYFMELAEEMPDTFGLSIDFDLGVEERDGQKLVRCKRLLAATVVDTPAATDGLFRSAEKISFDAASPKNTGPDVEQPTANSSVMTPEELKAALAEALKPITDRLDKLEAAEAAETSGAGQGEFADMPADERKNVEAMGEEERKGYLAARKAFCAPASASTLAQPAAHDVGKIVDEAVKKAVEATTTKFIGSAPANLNSPAGGSENNRTGFSAKVKTYTEAGMSTAKAIRRAAVDVPAEYNAWVAAGRPAIK